MAGKTGGSRLGTDRHVLDSGSAQMHWISQRKLVVSVEHNQERDGSLSGLISTQIRTDPAVPHYVPTAVKKQGYCSMTLEEYIDTCYTSFEEI